jgi:hypothetical protein
MIWQSDKEGNEISLSFLLPPTFEGVRMLIIKYDPANEAIGYFHAKEVTLVPLERGMTRRQHSI